MRRIMCLSLLTAAVALLGATELKSAAPGSITTVRIRDMQFQPSSVRVKVGDSVTWTNADDRDHSVNATDNSFQSGNLKPGASYTYRFTKAGSFDYACSYHPRMRGSVQADQ